MYLIISYLYDLQDALTLNNMLFKNLLAGDPRKAIIFKTEDLADGLQVKYILIINKKTYTFLKCNKNYNQKFSFGL